MDDTIYTRDTWMHRIDTCRAIGVEPHVTADHDGVVVADIVREWAARHGQPFDLRLTGRVGGAFGSGGGESFELSVTACSCPQPAAAMNARHDLEMAKQYRLGPMRRAVNVVMSGLLRLGVPAPQRTSYLMTTRGRRSGQERTTPVNLVETDGERWLVSPYGAVAWVHNLRADPRLILRRGRQRETKVAHEVGPADAGPILRRYVQQVPITGPFFDARREDPVAVFVAEADRHPVFRLAAPD